MGAGVRGSEPDGPTTGVLDTFLPVGSNYPGLCGVEVVYEYPGVYDAGEDYEEGVALGCCLGYASGCVLVHGSPSRIARGVRRLPTKVGVDREYPTPGKVGRVILSTEGGGVFLEGGYHSIAVSGKAGS